MTTPERTYRDTLRALRDSQRSPEEMAKAAHVLDSLLDARPRVQEENDAVAARILKCAQGVREVRSGVGCDLALNYLRLALGDAREIVRAS